VAERVLRERPTFVKIMPHDYRRALEELAAVSTGGDGFYVSETEEAVA
jgi:hypothetical protein